jgi:hypothetical protein
MNNQIKLALFGVGVTIMFVAMWWLLGRKLDLDKR